MEKIEFVRAGIYLLTVALGGLAVWYKGNAKVSGCVSALIAEAENRYHDFTKAGGLKFEWVVQSLYTLLPAAVRPFVPQTIIRTLVQATFDAVEEYAKLQFDRVADYAAQEKAAN